MPAATRARRTGLRHVFEPQGQDQQGKEPLRVVPAACVVLRHQGAQELRGDDAAIQEARRVQVVPQERAQGAAEPVIQRNAEAHLGTMQQFRRQPVAQRVDQDVLAPAVDDLPVVRNGGGQFRQFVIQQRTAHFQRRRHGHAVHLHQHVAGQIRRRLEVHHLRQRVLRRSGGISCAPKAASAGSIQSGRSRRERM